jgi:ABC-type polar amino acid transport system ATPase subunit
VERGDVIVIIGPFGSGKMTLLRCINFLERADAGVLTLGDGSPLDLTCTGIKQTFSARFNFRTGWKGHTWGEWLGTSC